MRASALDAWRWLASEGERGLATRGGGRLRGYVSMSSPALQNTFAAIQRAGRVALAGIRMMAKLHAPLPGSSRREKVLLSRGRPRKVQKAVEVKQVSGVSTRTDHRHMTGFIALANDAVERGLSTLPVSLRHFISAMVSWKRKFTQQ